MNRSEALNTMKQGNKITHEYFSDDEYLYKDNKGVIRSEEGYNFDEWFEDGINWKETGWNIKTE